MKNRQISQYAVPAGVVAVVLLLVVPLPAPILDFLIVVNITASLVILLTAMYVKKPLDFSVFPSLILIFTLFRLGLNVASTRLVLRDGYAGDVIDAFGHFVVGGSLVIGLVVFLILVVIQFVVITNGAGRVAEVGARFTLDAMPGKQMAIDADLNSGLIDEDQARRRRAEVSAEADFYGAMDGGSKFVKGDAIAGIVITVINLIGGFAIGMMQMGMSAGEAINRFSLLTIGDGLVTQIPALLLSVATGIVVTRATAEGDMGTVASKQLMQSRSALTIAGVAAIGLGMLPAMPKMPFLTVGILLLVAAQRIKTAEAKAEKAAAAQAVDAPKSSPADDQDALMDQMRVHPLEIMLAPDLVDLVSGGGVDGDLLNRVKSLRKKLALELGIVVPPVRTRDNYELGHSRYSVRISGVEVASGVLPAGQLLALGEDLDALPGQSVIEPVFGLPGKWIPNEMRHAAELAGATVVDRVSVLITHLGSVITENAPRLLGREEVRLLTESVKKVNPSVVEELIPNILSLGEVQQVLQGLLTERVPIRDLSRIYEAIALKAKQSTDAGTLVEAARVALGPALCAQYASDGVLRVLTLDALLERNLAEVMRPSDLGPQLLLEPASAEHLLEQVRTVQANAEEAGVDVALVCAPALRSALYRLVALGGLKTPVLSYTEVNGSRVPVEPVGTVTAPASTPAVG